MPTNRSQIVNELSYLEHEKSRLEHELHLWREKERCSVERLQMVEARLALLRQSLNPPSEQPVAQPRTVQSPMAVTNQDDSADRNWKEITFEY